MAELATGPGPDKRAAVVLAVALISIIRASNTVRSDDEGDRPGYEEASSSLSKVHQVSPAPGSQLSTGTNNISLRADLQ